MHLPMVRMTNTFVLERHRGPRRHHPRHRARRVRRQARRRQVNTATGDFVFGMTEAYLIENGEITEPLREGNLIGNGPAGAARHRPARQRLRHGQPGHVRQGRPGRAGRRRPADAAGEGADHRRHARHERRDRRRRAAGARRPGRRPGRRPASRSRRTSRAAARPRSASTRARSSTSSSAQSEGIGIRVIRDGRTGFAYAGTLDDGAIAEVLAEARDNVAFGTVDEWAGLAEPDGVRRHRADAVERRRWPTFPTDGKIDLAKELERLTLGRRPARPRRRRQLRRRAAARSAVATTTGIRAAGRENGCYVVVSARSPTTATRPRPASASRVGRAPDELRPRQGRRARPPTGRPGCSAPPSRRAERLTVVLDPFVTAQFLGIISSTLNGEAW